MDQAKVIGDAFARSDFNEVKRLSKLYVNKSPQNMYCFYANAGVSYINATLTFDEVSNRHFIIL